MLENERGKIVWDFKFYLLKTTMAKRPDLTLEDMDLDCNIACPQQRNNEAERLEKLTKYRDLVYKSRNWHPKYEIMAVVLVIVALGTGIRQIMVDMGKFFENKDLLK